MYKFTISLSSSLAQELYMWTKHAFKRPSTCEQVWYVWTGPPTDMPLYYIYIYIYIYRCLSTYHDIPCQAIPYTMRCLPGHIIYHVMPTRPKHIPCHGRQAIPYIMPCPPGHTIHHSLPARPYHTPCHARKAIPYTMPSPMPCLAGYNHIPCDAHQAIPYTMPSPCLACQAIPYTMRCLPGHTIYHVMPTRP